MIFLASHIDWLVKWWWVEDPNSSNSDQVIQGRSGLFGDEISVIVHVVCRFLDGLKIKFKKSLLHSRFWLIIVSYFSLSQVIFQWQIFVCSFSIGPMIENVVSLKTNHKKPILDFNQLFIVYFHFCFIKYILLGRAARDTRDKLGGPR